MTALMRRKRPLVFILTVGLLLAATTALGQEARQPVNALELLLRAARNCSNAGKFDKAVTYYRRYLESRPNDTPVAVEFAGVLVSAGKVNEAVSLLRKIVEKEPNNLIAVQRLADTYLIKKDFPAAANLLEAAVKRFSKDRQLRRRLAEVYTWSGRYKDAVAQYKFLLKQKPGDVETEKMVLRALYWGRLHDEYLNESAAYLKRHPKDMAVWLTRLGLYEARKDFPGAIHECRAILKLVPEHRVALAKLAQCLAWLGERNAAIEAYEAALAQNPKDTGLRRQYAQQLLWSGRHRRAVLIYRKLKTDLPGNEDVVREYLESAGGVQPMESQEVAFVRAFHKSHFLAEKRLQPGTLSALAKTLQLAGQAAEALAVFQKAVQLAPQDVPLRLQYADLLSTLGRTEEAEKQYQMLLQKVGKVPKKPG